ncbi:hypothetical protein C6501_18265 [Candidatus Poribacteria bacterium]|nr:MAG: hypothetical protein C6501_18265 [Candidatus Poribacteria bacterium]
MWRLMFASIFFWVFPMSAFCQFADLPTDAKTVDFGISGDSGSQTLSLTAVLPFKNINGWGGIFGSRASDEDGVDTEIIKAHLQGGMRINNFGIEAFTDLERNISQGSALTSQIGSYIRPGIYEKGTLRISGGIGYFIENIQPYKDLTLRKFDPTSFRWLAFSSIGWKKLNTVLKFTPEVGFKNYRFSAEPALTFNLTSRFGLRLSGSLTYNSAPLTDNLHYKYLSILRVTL